MPSLKDTAERRCHDEPQTALAAVLDAQGRRLVWVAERLGVDSSTVSRWRSGDRPVPERRRSQLAAILGVDVAELFEARPGSCELAG